MIVVNVFGVFFFFFHKFFLLFMYKNRGLIAVEQAELALAR
jgi:hypothetical protein